MGMVDVAGRNSTRWVAGASDSAVGRRAGLVSTRTFTFGLVTTVQSAEMDYCRRYYIDCVVKATQLSALLRRPSDWSSEGECQRVPDACGPFESNFNSRFDLASSVRSSLIPLSTYSAGSFLRRLGRRRSLLDSDLRLALAVLLFRDDSETRDWGGGPTATEGTRWNMGIPMNGKRGGVRSGESRIH